MKCQKCGTDIPEGKIYCEKCGSAIQMVPDYNPVDDISIDTDTPDAQPDMEATSKPDTEEQPQQRKIHWKRWAVGILLLVLGGYTTYQIAYRSFGSVQETAEDEIILLEKPEFSTSPGCYTHSLQLILSHTDRANGVIYYTLDGSTPDADSSVYNGPITIEEGTTVVRAVFMYLREHTMEVFMSRSVQGRKATSTIPPMEKNLIGMQPAIQVLFRSIRG